MRKAAVAQKRDYPEAVQVDNGPAFISRAVDQWACAHGVRLYFIERGKPTQNAYIESFKGKFRDECLNQNWFLDLADARRIIAAWRVDYNTARRHCARRSACRRRKAWPGWRSKRSGWSASIRMPPPAGGKVWKRCSPSTGWGCRRRCAAA